MPGGGRMFRPGISALRARSSTNSIYICLLQTPQHQWVVISWPGSSFREERNREKVIVSVFFVALFIEASGCQYWLSLIWIAIFHGKITPICFTSVQLPREATP
jgi:hypothetical protein